MSPIRGKQQVVIALVVPLRIEFNHINALEKRMSVKKYRVQLNSEERNYLTHFTSRGKISARKLTHAQILLHADEESSAGALKDTAIAKAVHFSRLTVEVQKRRRPKKLAGKGKVFLVAMACSPVPDGRSDWTLQLLADRLIECNIVDAISGETVRKTLKKTHLSLG